MLLTILLVILVLDCVALVGVILLQRSEGGALGMGGGPSGFLTARGAGDLLTRTTSILGAVFFGLSLLITILAGAQRKSDSVTERLDLRAQPGAMQPQQAPSPSGAPGNGQPAAPPLPDQAPPPLPGSAPAPAGPANDPLAGLGQPAQAPAPAQ